MHKKIEEKRKQQSYGIALESVRAAKILFTTIGTSGVER